MTSTRRQFLTKSGLAVAGTAMLSHASLEAAEAPVVPGNLPLGFQAFEIVPDLNKDWDGTLKQMVSMGYKLIDMVAMNPYNLRTSKELKAEFARVGLQCNVCHWGYAAWNNTFGQTMDYSNGLGVKHVICGPKPQLRTTDDWKSMAADLNKFGAMAKKEGLTIAYHNHEIEFVKTPQGDVPWDVLMMNTDPAIVRYQIDVGNLTFGGGDAVEHLRKYNNRYFSFHAKDFVRGKAAVPVGAGTLDWKTIFQLALQAKVESVIAEVGAYGANTLDGAPLEKADLSILESYRRSAEFLLAFKG
ncbi:MAG: TIM barrel protein [Acidobacteria bacterium]|nr:TIM barrel protein [Acidobacteriota bacterium]